MFTLLSADGHDISCSFETKKQTQIKCWNKIKQKWKMLSLKGRQSNKIKTRMTTSIRNNNKGILRNREISLEVS